MEKTRCVISYPLDLAPGPYRSTRVAASLWLCEIEVNRIPALIPVETLYERDRRRALPAEEIIAACLMRKIDIRYRRAYAALSRGAGLITETWEIAPCAHVHKALPYRRDVLIIPREVSERIAESGKAPFTGPVLLRYEFMYPVRKDGR